MKKQPLEQSIVAVFVDYRLCNAGAAWSLADPWTFASLSYDGRLVVNRVPSHTKYKILI